jgi:hypothetical protein
LGSSSVVGHSFMNAGTSSSAPDAPSTSIDSRVRPTRRSRFASRAALSHMRNSLRLGRSPRESITATSSSSESSFSLSL